jgi:hypothetical protein
VSSSFKYPVALILVRYVKPGIVAIALASAVLLIPVIAIAQAISYGWGSMFNMAYMGVQSAMGSYGMPGAMHGMGGMMGCFSFHYYL